EPSVPAAPVPSAPSIDVPLPLVEAAAYDVAPSADDVELPRNDRPPVALLVVSVASVLVLAGWFTRHLASSQVTAAPAAAMRSSNDAAPRASAPEVPRASNVATAAPVVPSAPPATTSSTGVLKTAGAPLGRRIF